MVLHQTQLAHSTVTVLLQSQCVVPDILSQISCSLCLASVSPVCQCVCLFGLFLLIYVLDRLCCHRGSISIFGVSVSNLKKFHFRVQFL